MSGEDKMLTALVCVCLFVLFAVINDGTFAGLVTRYVCVTGLCVAWIIKIAK